MICLSAQTFSPDWHRGFFAFLNDYGRIDKGLILKALGEVAG